MSGAGTLAQGPAGVLALIESDRVTPPTRRALLDRLDEPAGPPHFFAPDAFATMAAACERLIPQPDRDRPIQLALRLDRRLADGEGDGWRYAKMPSDAEVFRQGALGLDQAATALFGQAFVALAGESQDAVLRAVQGGSASGAAWADMSAACYFEELLALVVDIYYAHPLAQAEIGYVGMADAHGWRAIGLDERER